jgi:hypothetical protein
MTEQSQSRSVSVRDSGAAAALKIRLNDQAKQAQVAPLPPQDAWKRYCESRLRHFEMAR